MLQHSSRHTPHPKPDRLHASVARLQFAHSWAPQAMPLAHTQVGTLRGPRGPSPLVGVSYNTHTQITQTETHCSGSAPQLAQIQDSRGTPSRPLSLSCSLSRSLALVQCSCALSLALSFSLVCTHLHAPHTGSAPRQCYTLCGMLSNALRLRQLLELKRKRLHGQLTAHHSLLLGLATEAGASGAHALPHARGERAGARVFR